MFCGTCNITFSKFSNYKAHVKKFHPDDFNQLPPHKPKEKAVTKCTKCQKEFTKHSNLKQHMKRFHDAAIDDQKKVYNYKCDLCNRQFSHLKNLKYHRKVHGLHLDNKNKFLKCPICREDFQKHTIVNHFEEKHNIKVETVILQFSSAEEFKAWKAETEKNTKCSFVKPQGSYSTQDCIKSKYICHRSGDFTSKSKGTRHLKAQGTNKINGFCPASLNVTEKNGLCEVLYTKTHVGHENDVGHLFLTESERVRLATKIAANVPLDSILDEVRNSVTDCELDKLHLLTKKDLYNIKQCFKLNSTSVRYKNDVVSMETWVNEMKNCRYQESLQTPSQTVEFSESQSSDDEEILIVFENSMDSEIIESVSKRQEKIDNDFKNELKEFKDIIMLQLDDIKTLDELEAVKEICAPIQSTLHAIRNSTNVLQSTIVIPHNIEINL